TFITSCRKRRHEPQPAPIGDLQDWQFARAAYPAPSGLGSPDTEVLAKLPDPRLQRAFHQLPGHLRTAVYLADIEGYGMKEIADILGTPIGTGTSRVYRARTQLRGLLPPPRRRRPIERTCPRTTRHHRRSGAGRPTPAQLDTPWAAHRLLFP